MKRGTLPRSRRRLGAAVDGIIKEYRADLGGDLSAGQEILLGQLRKCLLFMSMIDSWLSKQKELVDAGGNLPPALSGFYLAALNSSCRIARELGLERKAQGESLEKYLEGRARQAQGGQQQNPLIEHTGQAEIVDPEANAEGIPGGEA